MKKELIFTCEHGGNQIPDKWRANFSEAGDILRTHRGYDPGALALYRHLRDKLPSIGSYSEISRLLVELNRSLHHPSLFSEYTKKLSPADKKEILATWYHPYRDQVTNDIRELLASGTDRVIHISVHSFTPVLNGQVRNADVAFLYDPGRRPERKFCRYWADALKIKIPRLRIRFNYPYAGKADGFTTHLRRQFNENQYLGIELELNQALLVDPSQQELVFEAVTSSLKQTLSKTPESKQS